MKAWLLIGLLLVTSNASAYITTEIYDTLNRQTSQAGLITTYDEAGNKRSQTDAELRTTQWEYDAPRPSHCQSTALRPAQ